MSETPGPATESNSGNQSGISATAKYNPHLWSAEELRAIFVARKHELDTIVRVLQTVSPTTAPQHLLITGQRGMGKSTLLQRVALAVEDDQSLSKAWLPLRFPEEQYTVSTPAELWANVIGALADTLERHGRPVQDIDADLAKIANLPEAQREDASLVWLQQWCAAQHQRLLLLIDSTDLLFAGLAGGETGKRSKGQDGFTSALWRVRKTLSHSPHLLWLGGSYQPLEAHGLYSDAFLDFFQLIELRPLTLDEMQAAIQAMARIFGAGRGLKGDEAAEEVTRMLSARPERLRAIRQLTGGNPRTTVMLYELFAAGGRDNLKADIERLLDAMTPLYKSRLEVLADQPRKVLAHVMEHWAPISANALAKAASLPVGSISAQLKRLEQEGQVEKTALSGTKRYGYQTSERFFNIWYLMRNSPRVARARVGWLVEFMRLWYSSDELLGIARTRWAEHRGGLHGDRAELEYSRAIVRAMPEDAQERRQLDWTVFQQARKEASFSELYELQGEDADYSTPHNYFERLEALRGALSLAPIPEDEKSEWIQRITGALHLTLAEKEELAKDCARASVAKLAEVRQKLAERREKIIANHERSSVELVEQAAAGGKFFPDCPDSKLALIQMLECFESAPSAFSVALERLVSRCSDDSAESACKKAIELVPTSARPWDSLGDLLRDNLKRYDEAETAYRKAIELDPKWAMPWDDLGYLLRINLKRYDEAETAYHKAIELDPKWATPWDDLGDLLRDNLKRYDEAETAYHKAIELDPKWATPWDDLGDLLRDNLKRYDEAETAYHKAIELNPKWATPWDDLGYLLRVNLKRYDEAETAYRKAIELDPNWATPWGELGQLLGDNLKRYDEAETAYRKAIELDPKYVWPWGALGDLLRVNLKRYDEAETAYRKAIELDPKLAWPWVALGELLRENLKRYDEAETAYRKAIELDPKWAMPWVALGELLGVNLKRYDEAETAYRKAIELDPKLAWPWGALGDLLHVKLKRYDEAETAYRKAIELDPKYVWPWGALGDLLRVKLKRYDEAETAYRKVIELNPKWARPWGALGELLRENLKRYDEAETAYRKAIELDPKLAWLWGALGELLNENLKRYDEAELAYRQAIECDKTDPFSNANLARLLAKLKRNNEASELYRQSLELVDEDDDNLRLQAHCWLGNSDLALQALDALAERASKSEGSSFYQLKEQCFECHAIGLSKTLIDLMARSRYADFLQPFALALGAASGEKDALLDVAVEVRGMAEEVLAQISGTPS